MIHIEHFGEWNSPIKSEDVAEGGKRFSQIAVDGEDLYWLVGLPEEKGRLALFKNGEDLLPQFNVRSRVHEYGGGAFAVLDEKVYFCNDSDQKIYLYDKGSISQITQTNRRYADLLPYKNQLFAVCEEHGESVKNFIVKIDVMTGNELTLVEGADFYANLTLHPSGQELSFIQWNHPDQPWTESTLYTLNLETKDLKKIAGGSGISISLPRYSPNGSLYFSTDRSGYWNLATEKGALFDIEAESGEPFWVFGSSRIAFLNEEKIALILTEKGEDSLYIFDGTLQKISLPLTFMRSLHIYKRKLVFIGASPTTLPTLYSFDSETSQLTPLRHSGAHSLDEKMISLPERITFPTTNGEEAYGFYYPPKNPNCKGPEGEKPPLILKCHGGPTGHVNPVFSMEIQYWTSRGFGWCDVNYGGSTGYGRAYRDRLKGNWGIVDVADMINAALYLVQEGKVDREKLIIRGSSAGGFTTLCALTFHDLFRAGTSLYGVGDLESLQHETHKFESHYNDWLIGPPSQIEGLSKKRSPLYHTERLNVPVLFLQGSEDKIVPPSQSEAMYEALKKRGVPTKYILFEGEQHGFRKSETLIRALEEETRFYINFLLRS